MRSLAWIVSLLVMGACGSKGGDAQYAPDPGAKACPPGNVLKGDACTALVTSDQVGALTDTSGKLDALAKVLDAADAIRAPVAVLDSLRALDEWKLLAKASDKLAAVDALVGQLSAAAGQLKDLQTALKSSSGRMTKLAAALEVITKNTGPARKLENVQQQVAAEVAGALADLQPQLIAVIGKVTPQMSSQLDDLADALSGACTFAKMAGGGDKIADLCKQARDVFKTATRAIDDVSTRPEKLVGDLAQALTGKLGELANDDTKKAVAGAQAAVANAVNVRAAVQKAEESK